MAPLGRSAASASSGLFERPGYGIPQGSTSRCDCGASPAASAGSRSPRDSLFDRSHETPPSSAPRARGFQDGELPLPARLPPPKTSRQPEPSFKPRAEPLRAQPRAEPLRAEPRAEPLRSEPRAEPLKAELPVTKLSQLPIGTPPDKLMQLLLEPRLLTTLRGCDPKVAAAVEGKSSAGLAHFLWGLQSLGPPHLNDSPVELEPEGAWGLDDEYGSEEDEDEGEEEWDDEDEEVESETEARPLPEWLRGVEPHMEAADIQALLRRRLNEEPGLWDRMEREEPQALEAIIAIDPDETVSSACARHALGMRPA